VREKDREDVCGFTIAHIDEENRLIWYNGSLLKNKIVDKEAFEVPTHCMVDAVWEKGATKRDKSCMKGGQAVELAEGERDILKRSVEVAKRVDADQSLL
jgi:alpha 1,3-mannosyltransferase